VHHSIVYNVKAIIEHYNINHLQKKHAHGIP